MLRKYCIITVIISITMNIFISFLGFKIKNKIKDWNPKIEVIELIEFGRKRLNGYI